MDVDTITALLGKRSTDAVVEGALQRLGVVRRPQLEVDPYDYDGPVVKSQDFVSNLSAGIEFGFQEESAFMHLEAAGGGEGAMILTEVYFYGERPGTRSYRWQLPFGLSLSDSRSAVRAKMAPFERTRRSYVRDTWEHPSFRVTASFADDFSRIDVLICMLRAEVPELFDASGVTVPNVDVMIDLLGKSIDDSLVRHAFDSCGLDRSTPANGEREVIDLRQTCGLKLYFRKSSEVVRALLLSKIELASARGLESRGWQGALPFGIRFDDSPETVLQKVGQTPTRQEDQDFAGQAFWKFRDYSLLVTYSTMENSVLSVDLMAP